MSLRDKMVFAEVYEHDVDLYVLPSFEEYAMQENFVAGITLTATVRVLFQLSSTPT